MASLLLVLVAMSSLLCSTMAVESGAGPVGVARPVGVAGPVGAVDPPSSESASVYIVYTTVAYGKNTQGFQINSLDSIFGSEEAAKQAMLYTYKTDGYYGFSVKLTPDQVAAISKLPGVLQVTKSKTYQIHSGHGNIH
ncbi:uncharacterized protein LOC122066365 [Macadamia integrifolia]|uniref:uncharacterized protein LOC122066365 n=1 Tax=Macadamia integrifolia TaxID=60698 RepID=UPI001C4E8FE7|nr:uncharacterized protein LOC122066365 [Macadamia integrifolia]